MSSVRRGGCLALLGFLGFLVVCAVLSFAVLPSAGIGVGLPVIIVPGEPYDPRLPVESFRWTNTLTATVLASLAVIVFLVLAWRASKGWTKEVPNRFQSWVELLGGFMYDFAKRMAGKNARLLFPLVATIFIFLLAVNWMKLLPGVESVGVLHCAEEGFNGYPAAPFAGSFRLEVDAPLQAATGASYETYQACNNFFHHGDIHGPSEAEIESAAARLFNDEATLRQTLETEGATAEEIDADVQALRLEITQSIYPDAYYGLTPDQLRDGVMPYIFVVTPFVRGASTDLNLTIGLALIAVIAVQVFGVMAQGPVYFEKFVNISAIGNARKKPLGVIDFVVGLIEIISEIGKIVSLAFRLFGNMFAGGIVLIVMSFLVAFILPSIFIGLEVIITTIQAFVFAVLTLIFAAQAMEGHHGHDEEHDEAHGEAAQTAHNDMPIENRTI
jgi:F-type H+-transporting ATPase subunit a